MTKGNDHKKLFHLDHFSRKFYCEHAHLNQLRSDKKLAKKAVRKWNKMESRAAEFDGYTEAYLEIRKSVKNWPDWKIKLYNETLSAHGIPVEKIDCDG